jgi:hypothetical protein
MQERRRGGTSALERDPEKHALAKARVGTGFQKRLAPQLRRLP